MNPVYDVKVGGFSAYEQRVIKLAVALRGEPPVGDLPRARRAGTVVASARPRRALTKSAPSCSNLRQHRARWWWWPAPRGAGAVGPGGGLNNAEIDQFNRAVESAKAEPPREGMDRPRADARARSRAQIPADPTVWRLAAVAGHPAGRRHRGGSVLARLNRNDPEVTKLLVEIDTMRHRLALPSDSQKFGIPPEREVAYVAGYRETTRR